MWRRAAAALMLALPLWLAVGTAAAPEPAPEQPASLTYEEQRFCELVNAERTKRGLGRLKVSLELTQIARGHSREMASLNYFSHYSPTPGLRTPMDRYKAAMSERMPAYLCVGENLYYGGQPDVERGHGMLMASPRHKENMLRAEYQYVGVGVYLAPDGQLWATEMFMSRRS